MGIGLKSGTTGACLALSFTRASSTLGSKSGVHFPSFLQVDSISLHDGLSGIEGGVMQVM